MRISRFLWVSCAMLASCSEGHVMPGTSIDGGTESSGGARQTGGRTSTGGFDTGGFVPAGGFPAGGFPTGGSFPGGAGAGGAFPTGGSFPTPTGGAPNNCDVQGRCPTPPLPEPPGTKLCGGVECAAGMECCLATLQCFDPNGSRASCPRPPGQNPQGQRACASNSDCQDNEYCNVAPNGLCGGPGHCESREMCPQDAAPTEYCGCDGRTYTSRQHACSVGVRAPNAGPCGVATVIGRGGGSPGLSVIPCGSDNDCVEECCEITGTCYKAAQAAICTLPPPGTSRPCLSNLDCFRNTEYCDAATCGGPGGCKPLGSCTGALVPVCGCDGFTYDSAGCAAKVGMRVASVGECGDGG